MKYPGFIGPSYQSDVATADQERSMNLYMEKVESPGGTTQYTLNSMPGVELIVATSSTDGRAHTFIGGREFAVIGTSLIEFDSDGVPTFRGSIAIDTNPATISSNGDGGGELFITSGGNGYLFTLATNVLTTISALSAKATMGDQLDGYFLTIDADTGTMYSSELLDGTTWTTGTMFAQRNAAPDPWVAMKVKGKLIYLLGDQTGEVWFDSGASPFPFAPHPSGGMQYGIAAPFSLTVCDDSLMWLGASKSGNGFVMRATGFTPEVVSTYPVQFAINNYDTVSDAYGDTFTWNGHTFYVLSFPTANRTWVYDLQMSMWTELGTWDPTHTAGYGVYRPKCHAFAFGEHRWLHGSGTGLYRMVAVGTDVDSLTIRRERIGPTIEEENKRIFHSEFELLLEPGLGLTSPQERKNNPQVMMQFSDDGGKTWSKERWAPAGKVGEYTLRVHWHRLGASRRRVYRVVMTDPVPFRMTGATIRAQPAEESA